MFPLSSVVFAVESVAEAVTEWPPSERCQLHPQLIHRFERIHSLPLPCIAGSLLQAEQAVRHVPAAVRFAGSSHVGDSGAHCVDSPAEKVLNGGAPFHPRAQHE